jgi:hypothetical protein
MYFETDTGRLIIYGGSGWSQYSPAAAGESVDDSGEINISYGTFDQILAQDKRPGDLFYMRPEDYVTEFTFTRIPGGISGPANNAYFYITFMDDDDVYTLYTAQFRLTVNSTGPSHYVDMNESDWGTPNWQGSQNLIDNLAANIFPTGTSAVVSGENNETVTIISKDWFIITNTPSDGITGYINHTVNPTEYKSSSLLVYNGLDQYDNEVFSQIESK